MRWNPLYIHLGEDVVIRASDVVAILEWHPTDELNDYIEHFKKEDKLIDISDNDKKSLVITTDKLYLSPLSSLTLKRRALDETATYLSKIEVLDIESE